MRLLRALSLAVVAVALLVGVQSAAYSVEAPDVSAQSPDVSRVNAGVSHGAVDEDLRRALEVLEGLSTTYRHLEGVTVTMGSTPNGEEAVAYYTDGEILVDPSHTEPIERILAHEIWHIIDWRDDGQLDWGEDLPPHNSSDYFRK